MDAGAFVQENKRWLVGCAIGGLVWLIASSVVDALYDPDDHRVSMRKLGALEAAYDSSTLGEAQAESEALAAERARLEREIAFVVADRYATWSGPADEYLYVVGRNLKRAILDRGSLGDVLVEEAGISWDKPAGIDEIRRVLFGLDLMDEVQQRLFDAHDAARAADEQALGLAAIKMLKLESDRGRRPMRNSRRDRGGVDLEDLLQQQRVNVAFDADEATVAAFLEACRKPGRTLVVDTWSLTLPVRAGEPCSVKATLAGIAFVPQAEEDN